MLSYLTCTIYVVFCHQHGTGLCALFYIDVQKKLDCVFVIDTYCLLVEGVYSPPSSRALLL